MKSMALRINTICQHMIYINWS